MDAHTKTVLALLVDQGPRLHAVLLRITLREDVTEDLMQELFLRLHRRRATSGLSNPVGYAVRTATRLAFDWRRSQRRRIDGSSIVEEPTYDTGQELSELERREDLQIVLDSIGQLPSTSRDIVVMRFLEEQSYDAIAGAMNKTPHQVRALCSKAIARLRQLLATTQLANSTSKGGADHE